MNVLVGMTLRAVIGVGILFTLFMQIVVLPGLSGQMAQEYPEVAFLRWPVLVEAIVGLACVHVVLVCLWKLLGEVEAARIFSPRSFRWVDAIIVALAVATAACLVLLIEILVAAVGPITVPALGFLGLLVVAGMLMLMIVMRGLLRRATSLQVEMDAVI